MKINILRRPGGRYMLKEILIPANSHPQTALEALEECHEDGWEVCGVAPACLAAIWVYYRRTTS